MPLKRVLGLIGVAISTLLLAAVLDYIENDPYADLADDTEED